MRRNAGLSLLLCIVWLLVSLGSAGASPTNSTVHGPSPAPPASPTRLPVGRGPAAPTTVDCAPLCVQLVSDGSVTSFTIADPKVFWYSVPPCNPATAQAPTGSSDETIQRIATYGSVTRLLFSRSIILTCTSYDPDVLSNIVSDGSYLYWMSSLKNGLVKLSVDANAGDPTSLVTTAISGSAELVLAQGFVFALLPGQSNDSLWRVKPSDGSSTMLDNTLASGSFNFQTDNAFLYWLSGQSLEEWDLHFGGFGQIDGSVTGYLPLGQVVYVGQDNSITEISNLGDSPISIYTSSYPTTTVYSLAADGSNLFWFEDRTGTCLPMPCFPPHDFVLMRSGLDGSNVASLHVDSGGLGGRAGPLIGDGDFLFWQENSNIWRMPKNAAALPVINMVADSVEVTQGIQDDLQDVELIRDRDTYVRFFVHSAGAAVPGVGAQLYGSTDGVNFTLGPLTPVNPAGSTLTVQSSPDRNNLNDSFLFELPYGWTETGSSPLYLRAVLNPYDDPLEPNYGDNSADSPGFFFQASPRIVVYFINWGYTLNNTTYFARFIKDVIQTFSWVRRVYPVASSAGMLTDPTPGFRPNLWTIWDDGLGSRVNQTAAGCTDNLCASAYTNNLMQAMRVENGIPNSIFMYGMISDAAGIFPRGQACCGTAVSSGPAGSGNWGWDYDGSYADWYAGHEIGHTLGRAHPASSAAACGNSADDHAYPYPNGNIGPSPNTHNMEGFDVGDASLSLPLAIYPGTTWNDLMTYCSNIWISNYNYLAMYNYAIAHPPPAAPVWGPQAATPLQPSINGNWLAVYGNIVTGATANAIAHVPGFAPSANSAVLTRVRHLTTVASLPPLVAGPYSIELFDAGNHMLASYPFTPGAATPDAPNWLPFAQVVNYVANTSQLRIVQLAGNVTLATRAIPANDVTVGNVALVGAPNPVSGVVTLSWTSGDADGDPLTFDIFYSRDNGVTVQPVKNGVTGNSTTIDTSQLGGSSTAKFRVVATDGVNTAHAGSPTFTMASKPPQPMILSPANGTHRHYGQLINFSGQALDAQDGSVGGSGLAWSDESGPLGTGALLSISSLPVGTHTIALKATDSVNRSASTSITVVVDDDLSLPGPTISAGPGQFSWSFASNVSPAQVATLKIHNAGGGTLNWTLSTDATWLHPSATSGTAPTDNITLTANPSGLGNDTAHGGHLFINIQGGSPAQQVTIPVDIAIGGSASAPPLWADLLRLPLVRR